MKHFKFKLTQSGMPDIDLEVREHLAGGYEICLKGQSKNFWNLAKCKDEVDLKRKFLTEVDWSSGSNLKLFVDNADNLLSEFRVYFYEGHKDRKKFELLTAIQNICLTYAEKYAIGE